MSCKYKYILFYVTDLERSVAFYRDRLDFTFGEYQDKVAMLSFGSANLILHLNEEKDFVSSPKKGLGVLLGFGVDDVDAYHNQLISKGVAHPSTAQRRAVGRPRNGTLRSRRLRTLVHSKPARVG